jgi:hypothetical protein
MQLGPHSVVVAGISVSGSPGRTVYTTSVYGTNESRPEYTLQIDLKNGSQRDMKEVLAKVYMSLRAVTAAAPLFAKPLDGGDSVKISNVRRRPGRSDSLDRREEFGH